MKLSNMLYNLSYLSLSGATFGTFLAVTIQPLLGMKLTLYGVTACSVMACMGTYFDKREKEWMMASKN